MRIPIARRLDALEQRHSKAARKVVVLMATDSSDVDRQIAEMISSGLLAPSDGVLCITGQPTVQA